MAPIRPLAFLIALLLLAVTVPAGAQDLGALRREAQALTRDSLNLDTAIERQGAENTRLLGQLNAVTEADGVTFKALRQAQFEVDIVSNRLLTLEHRIAEQADRLTELNQAIVRASAALTAGDETLAKVVAEAELEWRQTIRDTAAATVDKLMRYRELSDAYLDLRQEELAVLQRVISLAALEGATPVADMPVVVRLRGLVDELAQHALFLSNEASAIAETNADAILRRNLLRLRSDEALLRSNARLTDIALVEARAVAAGLEPMLSEPSVPIRLFDEALVAIRTVDDALALRLAAIAANREALADFNRLLAEQPRDPTADMLRTRIEGLQRLLVTQDSEIRALRGTAEETRTALTRERAVRDRAQLFIRERARTDEAARSRITAELRALPATLETLFASRVAEVRTAVEVAGRSQVATFAAAVVGLLAAFLFMRRGLLRRFISSSATRATELPLELVRRNLFWMLPVALWWVFVQVFAISATTAVSVLTVLVIPAAAALLRDATQLIVTRRAEGSRRRIGTIITRATEVAVVLSSVFLLIYAVLGEVPLLPSTQAAINRLVYSVFVLSGLPMLLFVFFFASARGGGSYGRVRHLLAGLLSLLPPAALIATGATGLAGYTTLAAVMLINLAFVMAIGVGLALALGILNDVILAIAARVRKHDPVRAFFVRANFLQPLLRAGQIALMSGAVLVAVSVFGWTADTPVVSDALRLWRDPVVTMGGTAYSLRDVVFSALGFVFVFWLAAWSRRVAYTIVFGQLKDIGIRQSLSVFTQYVIIVIGVLLTLSLVGFDVTTLTVFAASLGVGIGFGLQNVVNNFISGLLLLVERPLRIGDIVTVGANSGTVQQIGIRSMRMKTFDEFDLIVPNSALISDTFTNWTRTNSMMRVVIMVGIDYGSDPSEAIAIIDAILNAQPGVARQPEREVTVDDFTDSAVMVRICYYIDLRGKYSGFAVRSEVLTAIRARFGEAGITIPAPREVRVIASPAAGLHLSEAGELRRPEVAGAV